MNPKTVPDSMLEFQTWIKHDIQGDYNAMKETVVYHTQLATTQRETATLAV